MRELFSFPCAYLHILKGQGSLPGPRVQLAAGAQVGGMALEETQLPSHTAAVLMAQAPPLEPAPAGPQHPGGILLHFPRQA